MIPLPAITVRQPWAWAIASGHKPVENRGWTTRHRGTLAIHAGLIADMVDADVVASVADVDLAAVHEGARVRGAVIAVARLVGICTAGWGCGCGPWAARNQFHWRLEHVRALPEPVPCPGARGLWPLPEAVRARVLAQVTPATP